MRISAIFVFCGILGLSLAAQAQGTTDGGTTDTPPVVGSFDQLSPGNQKIAEALFEGQTIVGDETSEAWTLDQIATAKRDGQGWGEIFKQRKSDGLIDAKNLGQLVSAQSRSTGTVPHTVSGSATVITTGTGRTTSVEESEQVGHGKGLQNHKGSKRYSGITSGRGARGSLHSSSASRSFRASTASASGGGRGLGSGGPKIRPGKTK